MAGKQRLVRDPDAVGPQQSYEEEPVLTGAETGEGRIYRGDAEPTDPAPVAGDIWVDTTGGVPYQTKVYDGASWLPQPLVVKDGAGAELSKVSIDPISGDITLIAGIGGSWSQLVLEADGIARLSIVGDIGAYGIGDDGSLELKTPWGSVTIHSGGLEFGDFLAKPAGGIWLNLPTVDPVVVGQLWEDTGVVKVSAG